MSSTNPYAPPAAESVSAHGSPPGVSDYRAERRSVLLCIVLAVVTFGLYPAIWLLRRRAFLDRLDSSKKLAPWLPYAVIALQVVSFVFEALGKEGASLSRFAEGIAALLVLIASFRVAAMLTSDIARTGRLTPVSYGWTFFFNIFYLQHKLNQLAEIPPRLPKAGGPAADIAA